MIEKGVTSIRAAVLVKLLLLISTSILLSLSTRSFSCFLLLASSRMTARFARNYWSRVLQGSSSPRVVWMRLGMFCA